MPTGSLFRRHVIGGAENGESLGEIPFALEPFRHTEVAHERFVGAIEQNIPGLQITMQNPVLMRVRDRARDCGHELGSFLRLALKFCDSRGQAAAIRELHAVEGRAIFFSNCVDRQDTLVVQSRGCFCLSTESRNGAVGIHVSGQDHLQRDNAPREMLPRAVNDAHSAARNFLEQLEISEVRACTLHFLAVWI